MLSVTFLILGFLASAFASESLPEFLKPGKCADVSLQDNFDLNRYGGRWYQTEIIENPYMPFKKCINSNYDLTSDVNGFEVKTAGLDSNDEHSEMKGKIYPTDRFPDAHMHLDFPNVIGSPYKVIETDYDTYSCVYSCIDWNTYKTEFAFVFSRNPQNSGLASRKCAAVFKKNGVDFSNFITVPHSSDCEYKS